MNPREERGVLIAALCKLIPKDGQWVVPSQTAGDKRYLVNVQAGTCTCPDQQETGFKCKHLYAVEFTMKREQDLFGNITETRTMTFTEKKVYRQNWPAYDIAQTTEKHRFQVLLADLCAGIPEPVTSGIGRKPVPITDRLFAMVFKVYCGQSTRRYMADMNDARDGGYLSRGICWSQLCRFFRSPDFTDILRELVAHSALPLRAIESNFAVDSSGFSVGRFIRWIDEKYGTVRSGRDWVKVHVCAGVKTGVVTAVEIKGRDAGDAPLLPPLIRTTAESFQVRDVCADKAYLSAHNIDVIDAVGGTPFIAPKSNTKASAGGLFQKMFHFYQYQRDEFMTRYHKRSNVESTFSSIKRKFGSHVRSRDRVSMVNEALCKLIAHNVCCVIKSQVELGIEATFWQESECAGTIPIVTRA